MRPGSLGRDPGACRHGLGQTGWRTCPTWGLVVESPHLHGVRGVGQQRVLQPNRLLVLGGWGVGPFPEEAEGHLVRTQGPGRWQRWMVWLAAGELVLTAPSPTPPQPQPLLGSLSAGEPGAEQPQHGEHTVGVGRGQREVQQGRRGGGGWWLLPTEGRSLLGSGCWPHGSRS